MKKYYDKNNIELYGCDCLELNRKGIFSDINENNCEYISKKLKEKDK